jgi:DNA repair exonuclease SbcCD nuclease subunit
MPALITSDWHLNDKVRDRYRHDWQKQLRTLIKHHDVDTLLMLGDLTDEFDNHSAALVNDIVGHLTALTKLVDRVYIMRGNHDCVDPTTPFFKFVSAIPRVKWINSPTLDSIDGIGSVLFLPHTRNYETEWVAVWEEMPYDTVDLLCAHNTFAGTVSESGHDLGGIPPSAIPKHLRVVSGDIHKPQDVQHITYVGSPYTVDFGDNFDPRVLIINKGRVKSIACRGPQKRLITAPTADALIARMQTIGDDIVKFRVTITPHEALNWQGIKRTIITEAEQLGVRLHAIEAVVDGVQAKAKRYSVKTKSRRDDEILKEYCTRRGVEKEHVDTGLGIIKGRSK